MLQPRNILKMNQLFYYSSRSFASTVSWSLEHHPSSHHVIIWVCLFISFIHMKLNLTHLQIICRETTRGRLIWLSGAWQNSVRTFFSVDITLFGPLSLNHRCLLIWRWSFWSWTASSDDAALSVQKESVKCVNAHVYTLSSSRPQFVPHSFSAAQRISGRLPATVWRRIGASVCV